MATHATSSKSSNSLTYTVTYHTRAEPEQGLSGPAADVFLVPAALVRITRVDTVQIQMNDDECRVSVVVGIAKSIVMEPHLSGFTFITCDSIRLRIISTLDSWYRRIFRARVS